MVYSTVTARPCRQSSIATSAHSSRQPVATAYAACSSRGASAGVPSQKHVYRGVATGAVAGVPSACHARSFPLARLSPHSTCTCTELGTSTARRARRRPAASRRRAGVTACWMARRGARAAPLSPAAASPDGACTHVHTLLIQALKQRMVKNIRRCPAKARFCGQRGRTQRDRRPRTT